VPAANLVQFLIGGLLFSTFFFLTLHLQRVQGYGPVGAGAAFLPLCMAMLVGSLLASRLATRIGARAVLVAGLLVAAGALVWLGRATATGGYAAQVLLPSILFGVGLSFAVVTVMIAGSEDVPGDAARLASGLINMTLYVGGAIGLAFLSAVANHRTAAVLIEGGSQAAALTAGYTIAWTVAAGLATAAAVIALAFLRHHRVSGS
jgi:predicted MFS family arabinose efflux permease